MYCFFLTGGSEATLRGWMIIIAFIVLAVLFFYFFMPRLTASRFAKLPELKAPAKVAEKRLMGQQTVHSVTFELVEGKKIMFELSEEQYNAITEGASGILTYKETERHTKQFLAFVIEQ